MKDCSCCDCHPTKELSVEEWHDEYLKLAVYTVEALSERKKLIRQNAKLRELAKGLYEFAYAEYPRAAEAGFADDLRKLGIEVDE